MLTVHNRIYKGIPLGIAIRKQIGHDRIFRVRRGNGFWNSVDGAVYQDQYAYFVPTSINNPQSEPYRRQWIAAVHKWKYDLTDLQKKEYNRRAQKGLKMSGYNLFMREAMKGLVQMYVDRGDPSAYDYDKTDLTIDGVWNDLDLSSIVPAGAKAVLIAGHVEAASIGYTIKFRRKANTNEVNHAEMQTLRAGALRHRSAIVCLDTDRNIEYKADNQTWTTLSLTVRGWWT